MFAIYQTTLCRCIWCYIQLLCYLVYANVIIYNTLSNPKFNTIYSTYCDILINIVIN